ncbi:hypothetical protein DQ237_10385 [Blastococcus sp. TF02-8]|uniref:glycosyltransferase n=1 Tax=Blastococcus sp. TF02-8 TaxID=2250574 RepID=UPI000DEB5312|nr:glycosyltransferase [Blastococcus sp. TF02-8]RBY96259.1 hypothetical protein DQ237_10385 [Blastococcus sp. TF02-8]
MLGEPGALSVVMTTYQAGRYLDEQIMSIFDQTRPPYEIVISDDGSTDGTWRALERLALESPVAMRLLRNKRNMGLRLNVEQALSASTGDIIVLADQDDIWAPTKLEAIAASFEDPRVDAWFSDAELIDGEGRPLGRRAWEATAFNSSDQEALAKGGGLRRLLYGWTVTGATMAFRSHLLDVALPLPDSLDGAEPLYLHDGWIAVLAHLDGAIAVNPSKLVKYRQHPTQVTGMSMVETAPPGRATSRERQAELAREMRRVRLVTRRVRAHPERAWDARKLQELFALEGFLETRSSIAAGERAVGKVLAELSRGNYHRYGRGLRTALWDALPPRLRSLARND